MAVSRLANVENTVSRLEESLEDLWAGQSYNSGRTKQLRAELAALANRVYRIEVNMPKIPLSPEQQAVLDSLPSDAKPQEYDPGDFNKLGPES